jgi:hypothetical protein
MGPLKKNIIPALLSLFVFIVYVHNLSRFVYAGDVGDLVTAAAVGGVAHPPGYPLFTLLGFLLNNKIPLFTPAFKVGLISAASSALGVLFFYFLINRLVKSRLISVLSSLILAFSYFYWFYSEIGEVFALNNFFAILLLFLSTVFFQEGKRKYLYLLTLFTGLSLTNHHTIVLIFPSILILIFSRFSKEVREDWRILLKLISLFLLGLSIYAYVPIASSFNPPVNWGHVNNLDSFMSLILRKSYGTFSAGFFEMPSFAQRVFILKFYFFNLMTQLTLAVVVISTIGAIVLYRKKQYKLLLSMVLGFIFSGPAFIVYAGFPLYNSFTLGINERFLVLSSIFVVILFPFGLSALVAKLAHLLKRSMYKKIFTLVFFIVPLFLFLYNFPKTNLSNISTGNKLGLDFLTPLPKNSLLLMSGDTPLFNTWYVHYALKIRPDITIVNLNGFQNNQYALSIENKLIKQKLAKKDDEDIAVKVVMEIAKKRPVFSINPLQPKKGKKLSWVPYGLTYQLTDRIPSKEDYLRKSNEFWSIINPLKVIPGNNLAKSSLSLSEIPESYANSLLQTGSFYNNQFKDYNLGYSYLKLATIVSPDYPKSYQLLGVYYLLYRKDCQKSFDNLNKAKLLDSTNELTYYFLYMNLKDCGDNKQKEANLVNDYQKRFGSNFFKDFINLGKKYKEQSD